MVPLFLVALPSYSGATSCAPVSTPIYGDCENAVCGHVVFVDTEPGYGTCARLPVVVEDSELHRRILERELGALGMTGRGTYELALEREWHYPGYRLESVDDYRRFHRSPDPTRHRPKTSSTLTRMDEGAAARMADDWRRERERRGDELRSVMFRDFALVGVGLVPLTASVLLFVRGLSRAGRRRDFAAAFALPVVTFAYGFALIGTGIKFQDMGAACVVLSPLLLVLQAFLLAVVTGARSMMGGRRSRP